LHFLFHCGLTRGLPGGKEDREPDFGVDVYGNGRLIERFLKKPFGFGTRGMSQTDQASKFIRGQLFISGHSFAIPWDTHKREYLADHLVAQWLYDKLRPIIQKYKTIAGGFTSNTELRNKVLTPAPKKDEKPRVVPLPTGFEVPEAALPKYDFPGGAAKKGGKSKSTSPPVEGEGEGDSEATLAGSGNGTSEKTITITVSPADYDDLLERFGAANLEELETAVRDCLVAGVAFTLTPEQLSAALTVFKCDGDVGDLSDKIRTQLLKKVPVGTGR
jgi:hypothetical protein